MELQVSAYLFTTKRTEYPEYMLNNGCGMGVVVHTLDHVCKHLMDDDASEIPCDSADSTPDSTPASSENDSNVWSQYEFDFRSKGKMLTCCKNEFLAAENYLRGCKW